MTITYGSVCSGIEAASIAWEILGWRPAWFAQFDPQHIYKNGPDFPSAVLAYRWPHVKNLGDMTKIAAAIRRGEIESPDVLVGGTPCQAYSIAGLRKSLDDSRGRLTLAFFDLVNAIDEKRREQGKAPVIVVWENVPGVLNTKDNAFGCFLAGLAGESSELESPGKRWTNAGYVLGPERAVCWRVLDAQFFGVAQRRRRVFVVASARGDIDPAKILFESEGMRRNTPPRRETGQAVAALTANGVGVRGADDNQGQAGHLIPATITGAFRMRAFGEYADDETASTVKARDHKDATDLAVYSSNGHASFTHGIGPLCSKQGSEHETLAVHGTQDSDTLKNLAHTLGRNHGQENAVAYGIPGNWIGRAPENGGNATEPMLDISPCLTVADRHGVAYGFQPRIARNGRGDMGDIAHSLNAQSGETGNGDAAPCVAIAFAENSRNEVRLQDGDGQITGPLSAGGGKAGQGYPAVVAFQERGRADGRSLEINGDLAYALTAPNGGGRAQERNIADFRTMAVRRLTPVECERLQGFPDNHTLIPRDKRKQITADEYAYVRHHNPQITAEEAYRLAKDGPRYKAIGNSMAVPVMRWIGTRIAIAIERSGERA